MFWIAALAAKGALKALEEYKANTPEALAKKAKVEQARAEAVEKARQIVEAYPATGTFEQFQEASKLVIEEDARLQVAQERAAKAAAEKAAVRAQDEKRISAQASEKLRLDKIREEQRALTAVGTAEAEQQRIRSEISDAYDEINVGTARSTPLTMKYAIAVCERYGIDTTRPLRPQLRQTFPTGNSKEPSESTVTGAMAPDET